MAEQALPESRLGTKEYWDDVYGREVENFEDIGDEGEVWFGESSVEKMVDWVADNFSPELEHAPSILDMGTGNGHLLFALVDAGFPPSKMRGVDYSSPSIKLASAIAVSRGIAGISWDVLDVLRSAPESGSKCAYDLILDKGTFDAMALSSHPVDGRLPVELYPVKIHELLSPTGKFCITSCNFTEDELKTRFQAAGLHWSGRIEHPTFSFGGSKGSTVCTVIFSKRAPKDDLPPTAN